MSSSMPRAESEAFLAGLHVGIVSIPDSGHGPLTVPIWYAYEPGGELRLVTERASRKGKLLAKGVRVSLCAQTEAVPYKYVSVEGTVVAVEPADLERDIRPLAHRYLGRELGDRYVQATGADRTAGGNVLIRIRPERWLSVDYAKRFPT